MELDEFKAHWNIIQDKEFQQQKISPEDLKQIIMNITDTLGQLHKKSVYWRKASTEFIPFIICSTALIFLLKLIDSIFLHGKLTDSLEMMTYLTIIILFCIVTAWSGKRQEQIFTINNSGNVKEALKQTITAFKRFYLKVNTISLFLFPATYYAIIKLNKPYWLPSQQTVFITCAIATVVSLICSHWYYKVKFFKKLKSLEANLNLLED